MAATCAAVALWHEVLDTDHRTACLPKDLIDFGELGLTGEVRPVTNGQQRLSEARKNGFRRAIVPFANRPKEAIAGMAIHGVKSLARGRWIRGGGRRRGWSASVACARPRCNGHFVLRFVQVELRAARQRHAGDQAIALIHDRRERAAGLLQPVDLGLDVVRHEAHLPQPVAVHRVYAHLGGRHAEDQPTIAGVDVREVEDVAEKFGGRGPDPGSR
jgi:hypothetical protein